MYLCLELRADTLQLTRLSFAEYIVHMHVALKNYIIVGGSRGGGGPRKPASTVLET